MVASAQHKQNTFLVPAFIAAGFFLVAFGFPQASFADTAYGAGSYGSGSYGGVQAPVLSSIASGTPGQTSVTIAWTTDKNANSRADLGLTTSYGTASSSAPSVTSHTLTYTGLAASTLYHFTVTSTDSFGKASTSTDQTFTTASVPDTTPPVISSITSAPGSTNATITWSTNEAANSQVGYGTTAAYGATTTLDATLVISHSVSLSALLPETTYHFRIRTADGSGNASFSSDQLFTTLVAITTPSLPTHFSGSSARSTFVPTGSMVSSTVFVRNLDLKSAGGDVVSLQQFLIQNGYLTVGNDTGYFGALTQAALARFQAARGISPAVGYFGPVTRAAIASPGTTTTAPAQSAPVVTSGIFTRDLRGGTTGEDVRALQQWLNAHSYAVAASGPGAPGSETTKFGFATQAALARFQAAQGITPAAGYFGAKTRAYIQSNP